MQNILIAGVVAVAGFVGWLVFDNPSSSSAQVTPVAQGGPIVEVKVADLAGNEVIGKRVFDAKCAACHGENAAGREGTAPPLIHKYYEPSHHGDGAFISAVRNGVRAHHWKFGNMPPVMGVTDAEVKMLVTYVRAMQRANGIN